jgi:hypothetical protein
MGASSRERRDWLSRDVALDPIGLLGPPQGGLRQVLSCGRGGIGRHARFRFWWPWPWGFKSLRPHQTAIQCLKGEDDRIERLFLQKEQSTVTKH